MQGISGFVGFKGGVSCEVSHRGNAPDPRGEVALLLPCGNADAVGGMCGVAVKCIDITKKTDCEGISRLRD